MAAKRACYVSSDTTITRDSLVYRDTTIYVQLPRDTVRITDTLPVPMIGQKLNYGPVTKKNGLITVNAVIRNNILGIESYINDSSIFVRIDSLQKEVYHWKTHTTTIVTPPEKYVPGFYKFCLYWFIGTCIGIILFVISKFK